MDENETSSRVESILASVRKKLGGEEYYKHFDPDIIRHINSAFMILFQLGVGQTDIPFHITGESETWSDFVDEDRFQGVFDYVCDYVKLAFDPPSSQTLVGVLNENKAEMEWRLNVQAETPAFQ